MNRYAANIEDVAISGDTIWFFANDYNALFSKEIGNEFAEFRGSVPWEKREGVRLFGTIKIFENKLYLIPCTAKYIAVYSIEDGTFAKIEIRKDKVKQSTSYMAAVIYKHYLFMFGFESACIIRVNLIFNEIVYLNEWYEEIKEDIWDYGAPFFRKQAAVINDRAYIPFWNANYLLQVNLDTLSFCAYKLGTEKKGYAGICFYKNTLFCLPASKGENMICFKYENDQVLLETKELIKTFPDKEAIHFVGIVEENKCLAAYTINDKKGEQHIGKEVNIYCGNYFFASDNREYRCVYDKNSAKLIIFMKDTKEIIIEYMYVDYLYWNMFKSKVNVINIEKEQMDLKNYLSILHMAAFKEIKKRQSIGKIIYDNIAKI